MDLKQQCLFVHIKTGLLWEQGITVLLVEVNSINAFQTEELLKDLFCLALLELHANAVQVMNAQ